MDTPAPPTYELMRLARECRSNPRGFYLGAVKDRWTRLNADNDSLPETEQIIRNQESGEGAQYDAARLRFLAVLILWMLNCEAAERIYGRQVRMRLEAQYRALIIDALEQIEAGIDMPRPPRWLSYSVV